MNERDPLLDALRGLAIFAMLVAHAAPLLPGVPTAADFIREQLNDVASPLFALVMGMTAALGACSRPGLSLRRGWLAQLPKVVALLALGLLLPFTGSWVAIVLGQLGLVLSVGYPFVRLTPGRLTFAALAIAALADPLNGLLRHLLPLTGVLQVPVLDSLAQWAVLSPNYRLTNLLPWFLVGVALHATLRERKQERIGFILLVIAPVAYAVRPLVVRTTGSPVISGSIPDTLHDAGLVFALIAAVLLLRRMAPAFAECIGIPIRSAGALSLSLYVAHVLFIAAVAVPVARDGGSHPLLWAAIVVGGMALGWLWWRFFGRGPLERLIGAITRRVRASPVTGPARTAH
jgi:uncharacterized protein